LHDGLLHYSTFAMHATICQRHMRMIPILYVNACPAAQAPVSFFALQGTFVSCRSHCFGNSAT